VLWEKHAWLTARHGDSVEHNSQLELLQHASTTSLSDERTTDLRPHDVLCHTVLCRFHVVCLAVCLLW
jgi:hypothetical protein